MNKIKLFCQFCGGMLLESNIDNKQRLVCNQCREIAYENPIPASAVVVVEDNKILLVKRGIEPKKGFWCLPGGFQEISEGPKGCAQRELLEETGIKALSLELLDVYSQFKSSYDNVLLASWVVTEFTGSAKAGDDAADAKWFDINLIPDLAFESHQHFVNEYKIRKANLK